jgi:uncharacterized membrane protein YcfT
MHSTAGVELAAGRDGWLHGVVAFAKPFRMPDFFLISGLFLANVIGRDWRTYVDRKVVHYAYFYGLWVTLQFVVKAPYFAQLHGWPQVPVLYLEAFIEPLGTLWFIYLLPIFFVVAKATRGVPPLLIWLIAAALQIAPIETGWTLIDEFAGRFVYFYTGYVLATRVFALAAAVAARPLLALAGLLGWGLLNALLVLHDIAPLPFVSLALGLLGASAVVALSALMANNRLIKGDLFAALRYCGRNSIVIYLAFFLPMATVRMLLLHSGLITDIGTISALVTVAGVGGALALWRLVRGTRAAFLFERPDRFWIAPRARLALQPAE